MPSRSAVPSRGCILVFGPTAPKLHKQLGAPEPEPFSPAYHWQLDADAIARLSVRGLLSEAEADRARKRLIRRMAGEKPAEVAHG